MESININIETLGTNLESFQTGVDSIYNKCKSCGATPSAKTPAAIVTAIGKIYTDRYNAGKTAAGGDKKHTVSIAVQHTKKAICIVKVDGTQKSKTEHDFGTDFGEWAAASLSV